MRAAPSTEKISPAGRLNSRPMVSPARSEPPMPTRMVCPMDIGFGPGMARRPRAPTTRPLMMRPRMKRITSLVFLAPIPFTRSAARGRFR